MAITRPFTSSVNDHRDLEHRPAFQCQSEQHKLDIKEQELDEMLLRWGLFQTYGVELQEHNTDKDHVPLKTLPERLAALLITESADQNGAISGLRLQTIADYLGTYRETIAAILRVFVRKDFVALGCGRIDILDLPAMHDLADIDEWTHFGDKGIDQGKERHRQYPPAAAQLRS